MPEDKPYGIEEYQRIFATGQEDLINEYRLDVRRIQALMVLISCVSPHGELGRMMGYALALPGERWLSRATPVTNTSFTGIKTWIESMWGSADLSPGERKLVAWQNSLANIAAAVQELKDIEKKLDTKLAAQLVQ
ncbi:MAG: DurN family substrate-assisted peptide maturase [Pseudonocardiaceae bacterium]